MSYDKIVLTFGNVASLATRLWRRAADQRLQPHGLTEATWLPLVTISRSSSPMRQKELAAALSLDGSSIVRVLDNLEAAGMVTREEGEDRRVKVITLTPLGLQTVEKVEYVARNLREEALASLKPEDVETAYRVLDHIGAFMARDLGESA